MQLSTLSWRESGQSGQGNDPASERTRRKLQLCQLNIVKEIDQICREHGLTYYMVGGTLLGAVRHGGFIPWDDDLDIALFREDYQQLQEILIRDYADRFFLQNSQTDPRYPRVIAKVRLNGTVQLERTLAATGSHSGIYIDLFPIDRITKPDGPALRLRGRIVRLCFAYKTLQTGSDNQNRTKLKRFLKFVPKLIPPALIDRLMTYVCAKDNGKCGEFCTMFLSGYGWKKQTRKVSVYGKGVYLPFEDTQLCAPDDADAFLTKLFGDYMQLPPQEKRVAHKLIKVDFGYYDTALENQLERKSRTNREYNCANRAD